MRLFLKYIQEYCRDFALFLIFSVVFSVVFSFYNFSIEAILYSFAICLAIGFLFVSAGFSRFRKRYHILKDIYINLPLMTDELPPPDNLTQKEMQEIIKRLAEINQQNIETMRNIRQDNSDYFTVWVHQIKTPIAAMEMILQNEDSEISRELSAELFCIEQYAEMALQYIRLDSNSNDFVIKRYSIDNIIRQAVRRYASLFIRRRIKINCQPLSDEMVLTDEKWLVFVVEQLLSNAVKYTSKGCVTIRFENNILSISDTGIGIYPDDLPRIFEKGYTGMSGRTNKKSTGLGLYLCKKVCDKLEHKIYVESEVGKGTSVFIDLSTKDIDIE
ncbi:MAG: sensor histidine kinase [Ruminococcus sp.]|nr:sensor histidine kinase [Ruminococcus sp.]